MSETSKAVFLSYASQDAEAARRICEALRSGGVEVWFDADGGLEHGDEWDAKIRRQIKECVLFIPVISANTQARHEGYFRIEWELAAQRALGIASGVPFILPVVIDGTREPDALVPDRFRTVQWTRLKGGEVPPEVKQRFLKLWSHRTGVLKHETDAGRGRRTPSDSEAAAFGDAALQQKRRPARSWVGPAMVGAVLLIAIAAYFALRPRRSPEEIAKLIANAETIAANAAARSATADAPLTEAQKLVTKARKILDEGDELNAEHYFLAEDLLKRAVTLDPADAEAWTVYAELSFMMAWHGVDNTEARHDTMTRQAERARTLAPDSIDAQIAFANARILLIQDLPGVERDLLALAQRAPNDWRVQESLGNTYRFLQRKDESVRAMQRARELSGGSPRTSADLVNVLTRQSEFAAAENVVAEALPKGGCGRLFVFDLLLKTAWRGDFEGAAKALATWPDWLLTQDRGAYVAWRTWLLSRQADKALAAMQRLQRDFIRDANFTGPRAALAAQAHELAGHVEAARADWRITVQACDRELATAADSRAAQYWKAWALARLGDTAGAQALCQQMDQRKLLAPIASFFGWNDVPALWVTVGRSDLAIAELETRRPNDDRYAITRAQLEFDPAFDPLRTHPRFKEVLAAALAPEKNPPAMSAGADDKSVAVLAFADLSAAHDSEYFSDGISEELLNVLAKVPGLKVTARTSAFFFKGKNLPIPEIATKLGVAYVIEGSVQRAGEKIKITAQLIKAADGFHVWSDTFKRSAKDVFAVEEEIAGLIAKQLSLKLGASSASATALVNPVAFELYVQARQAWSLRTAAGFDRAEELLNRALALEPNSARAHAALADVWITRDQNASILGRFGQRNSAEVTRILAEVEKALALDPDSAEAHSSLGGVQWTNWNFTLAESELRRAIALNPNYASAHQLLGRVLGAEGRLEDALAELKRATELDPFSSRVLNNYASSLQDAGRLAEALAVIDRAVALQPDSDQALRGRARTLVALRRFDEAVASLQRIPDTYTRLVSSKIFVYALAGQRSEAEKLRAELSPQELTEDRVACLLALGRKDEALDALEPANAALGMERAYYEPLLDPIRAHPRFVQFLADLGLTEAHARAQAWRKAHPPEKPEVKP